MTARETPTSLPAPRIGRTIFDKGAEGRYSVTLPESDVPEIDIAELGPARSTAPGLPHVTEGEVARHYAGLASANWGVDSGLYPLGSCTMKYNPRVCEDVARLPMFADAHPYQDLGLVSTPRLMMMWELQDMLAEVTGFDAVTLQPAAGAHGELAALLVFRAFHTANGGPRKRVVIPDTAHGTNPASVALAGYETVTIPSGADGRVDLDALRAVLDSDVAALMLTNPNTLGLFERDILRITEMVHEVGALAYCDGANLNAIVGKARPGDMGFDALHINLHKTFGTPHGGGGPGSGPVAVKEHLATFLPGPVVARGDEVAEGVSIPMRDWPRPWDVSEPEVAAILSSAYRFVTPQRSIGRMRSFYGNFGVLVRAWAYLLSVGRQGLPRIAEQAVLSANYLQAKLKGVYDLPFDEPCMHEFVLSGRRQKREHGVRTLDIAKRLLDHGFHPPTVYFPLIVDEAMMIEPTETEDLDTLDAFVSAMLAIAEEATVDPETVKHAPYTTPVRRLDEARAAKEPDLIYRPDFSARLCE